MKINYPTKPVLREVRNILLCYRFDEGDVPELDSPLIFFNGVWWKGWFREGVFYSNLFNGSEWGNEKQENVTFWFYAGEK